MYQCTNVLYVLEVPRVLQVSSSRYSVISCTLCPPDVLYVLQFPRTIWYLFFDPSLYHGVCRLTMKYES